MDWSLFTTDLKNNNKISLIMIIMIIMMMMIIMIIIKITISSLVIGLKKAYFPLIR